jgi:DNA repair exonuclease SbcCD ATPase subunit
MSSDTPTKEELANELQRTLNTLSEEAQHAAIRKCGELGFDPHKGRISLEETLINLTQARDILLDAIDKSKFIQLPLKLQYALFDQVQAVARELTALVAGTDAVLNLDSAVEELNASVWQFQLHNLSDQVLGFHGKMNQLKSQETAIRQAARAAEEFDALRQKANQSLDGISERSKAIAEEQAAATKLVEQLQIVLRESTEIGQRVSSCGVQVAQHETTAAQQLATAKQAAADTEAIGTRSRELRTEIESTREALQELTTKAQQLLATTERTAATQLSDFAARYDELREKTESTSSTLTSKLDTSITDLTAQTTAKVETLIGSADSRVSELTADTATRLGKAEAAQEAQLAEQLQGFSTKSDAAMNTFVTRGDEAIRTGDTEVKRLVGQLEELEGRIREAIEKATGYTLFHAFQRRQLDIAKAKTFWAYALAVCVMTSLCVSGLFIWSLQFVQVYNAAFYLKLSVSIPLIYAIAFCNLQYSRERKLEEEYAFKSSVSISLDPYQRLVGTLVDKANPEELSKYTAFIIQSVSRVFTSPTEPIFEGTPNERNYAEQIIKAVGKTLGDVIEPLVKGLRR